jgi:AsmA-like C-terminal region
MQPLPPILNHDDPLRPYTPPPKSKNEGSWGKMKKILIMSTLTVVLLFSLLIIATGIMEDKIGAMVVKEANKQLKTKLSVQDFSISLISGFPKASAQLEGVFLNDVFGGQLLKARVVALEFSLFSVFSNNITISSIVIRDGIMVLKTDNRGKANFDILKPSEDKKSSSVSLSIDKAKLQNVRFIYMNAQDKQNADLTLKNALVSGKFGSKNFTLSSKADMNVAYFDNQGQKCLNNKPLTYDVQIAVDMIKNIYQLQNVSMTVASLPLQIKGLVQSVPQKGTFFNLAIQNKEGTISNLLQLLPPQYSSYFKDFQSSGNFTINATVKGLSNKTQVPDIQSVVHFKNGKIVSPKLKQSFEKVSFDAVYDNKKSILEITNCNATFAGNLLQIQLRMLNLKDPSVAFTMNGSLPLGLAFGLFNNPKVSDGAGIMRCNALQVNGKYNDMTNINTLQTIKASGEIAFENANLKINNEPIAVNGVLDFNNNAINVDRFNIRGAGSNVTFTGNFSNWLPVLLSDSTQQSDLIVDARLDADVMDIGRIMAIAQPKPQKIVPQSYYYAAKGLPIPQYRKQFPILNRMKGRFESNIKNFIYDKLSGRSFKGNIDFTGNDLLLKGSAIAMGGNWLLDGKLELGYRPHLFTKLTTNRIDITEFFRQCNNFGQSVLKNDNISGRLTSRMAINAYWDEGFNFLMDKLHVLSDLNITDGELVGFKMLENFSTYIKVQDLKKIKFYNLQNQFEIYKQTLHIPVMFIQSNALNMQVSGSHTFNQNIDYNIVVNAGQVLMSRFKIFNSRLDPQADQRNGLFNLYYNISGNIDKFQYSSDKVGVKNAFTESENRKKLVQAALVRIFDSNIQAIDNPMSSDAVRGNIGNSNDPQPVPPVNRIDRNKPTKNPNSRDDTEYLPGF